MAGKLRLDWSPEQIAGWLKRTHPEDECNQVSHETIYRSLFVQTRGVLKKELLSHLRSKRSMRRSKPVDPNGDRRGHIKDIVSIRQRPAAVEDRAVPGHWEGDLLSGPNNTYIATLVERHTRYVMLAKVAGKDTQTVVTALIKQAKKLPKELYKSLTWDRGKELTDHRRFTLATKIDVYFCDPQSPWQRGSNENTNGLLRQYFPKGTDLSVHSQAHLNKVARQLNERPRETLQFETPAERFNAVLRRPVEPAQYTSEQFQRLMADHGVVCSMSRSGNVWDNAAMESFFSSLKTERTARKMYRTRDDAKADVFDYIERFYNPKRRHSTIGYLSPMEFERQAGLA